MVRTKRKQGREGENKSSGEIKHMDENKESEGENKQIKSKGEKESKGENRSAREQE